MCELLFYVIWALLLPPLARGANIPHRASEIDIVSLYGIPPSARHMCAVVYVA
jgi:hypothetical protein